MAKFFFYHQMKNPDKIRQVSENYIINDAYIFIENAQKDPLSILISNNFQKNTTKLYGKLVTFPTMKFSECISRLEQIRGIQLDLTIRGRYKMKTVETVHVHPFWNDKNANNGNNEDNSGNSGNKKIISAWIIL